MTALITVEKAGSDERSFRDVFELCLLLHKEGGYAPLDVSKAANNCYQVLRENACFVARTQNGRAVGTLALTTLRFWYSAESFLQDAWFFVRPEYRGGDVGVLLMRAARAEADAQAKIAFVTVNNPDRRPKQTRMSIESQVAGYVPLGYTLKIR